MLLSILLSVVTSPRDVIQVNSPASLRSAFVNAEPGTKISIAPGEYGSNYFVGNLKGEPGKEIIIEGDPKNPPTFSGGSQAIQFSKISHVQISNLKVSNMSGNGINIDDGGGTGPVTSTHHLTLKNIEISNIASGNHDGIKLSGVDDFTVTGCKISRWGGQGIDMVGCHRGLIVDCEFRNGEDSGVQAKGGSSQIRIQNCYFDKSGQRAVNLGGSTGLQFFRPSLDRMEANGKYEARDLRVEGCTFKGSTAPIAFVGVDIARVNRNTFIYPDKWIFRILQETNQPGFVPCRKGTFENNLIMFSASKWSAGGVNIGPNTDPNSFVFKGNFWYCNDSPGASKPALPVQETEGTYGVDPLILEQADGRFTPRGGSPAAKVGAHSFKR